MIHRHRRYRTRNARRVLSRTNTASHIRATVGRSVGAHINQQAIKLRFTQAAGLPLL